MSTARPYVNETLSKLEVQLQAWGARLDAAVAKAGDAGREAKADSRKQYDELKAKLAAARAKLDEAKTAGGEKWDVLKDGVEHTWHDLEDTFKKLVH